MTANIVYEGDLRTVATHHTSQSIIETDAPIDNQGKGERFSPTDLVATALGSCMLTVMGIKARELGINIKDATASIEKIMITNPRRIGEIKVNIHFPTHAMVDEKQKVILERTALHCPVHKSLHPDIKCDIVFKWEGI